MFRANNRRDGASTTGSGGKLTLAWSYCTGGSVFSSPVVHAGVVYVASNNGTLTALTVRDGKHLWQMRTQSTFYSTPVIEQDTVFAGTLNGTFYALDSQSGSVRWQATIKPSGVRIWSSPIVAHGLVLFGTASELNEKPMLPGQVLALDAATGQVRWQHWIEPDGAPGGGVWSSPAVDEETGSVYVATGDPDDGVQALSLQDGHQLWHWRSVEHDIADTDIGSGPTLYHDSQGLLRVAVGGKDGTVYSLNAQTGALLWHTSVGDQIYSSPAFADASLYVVGVRGRNAISWALSGDNGTPRWQHTISTIVYASPAIAPGTLYIPIGNGFGVADGGIEIVDTANGQLKYYLDLHSTTSSSPALLLSWLFIGSHNGNLYVFIREK